MKVLLDENMPHGVRSALVDHEVVTARHLGWDGIRNGLLLRKAEKAGFKALITADQNMSYQQNIVGRSIALVVLDTNRWSRIQPRMAAVAEALEKSAPGAIIYLQI